MEALEARRWRFKGPEMEGPIAKWYARTRGTDAQLQAYKKQAAILTAGLPAGARILEVAPGPGYLAIEVARGRRFEVVGLDISGTFVEIATRNARQAGVSVEFRQGDVARMPFASESFDLLVCQAAFKNFVQPSTALTEMHRVLRPSGAAVIQDMSRDATHADIDHEVAAMQLGRVRAFATRATLEALKRRAYTAGQFETLATRSPFRTCSITTSGIGLEVRLLKENPPAA